MDEEQRRKLAQTTAPQPAFNLNAQPQNVARLPADGSDRSLLSRGLPPFPVGAQATIAKPEVPTAAAVATGELRGRGSVIGGGRMDMERTPIQTPYGTIYATKEQQTNMAAAQSRQEDRQMALARASEGGLLAGQRLQDQGRNRYYSFRQGLEENRAQEALSTAGGRSPDVMRGAQAMVEAERMRQAQQGRSPMNQSPLNFRGMQFRQSGMGGFAPVRGFGDNWAMTLASGSQSYQPTFGAQQPTQPTTTSGFWDTVNGAMPSIAAPVKTPQTPTLAASVVGTSFANRIMQPEEDRFGGLKTAMGVPSMRRIGLAPFGLRS